MGKDGLMLFVFLSFFQFKSMICVYICSSFLVLLTCRFVIWFFFIRLSIFFLFVIIGGTAYRVLFIDARNFLVCLWRAEAVSELITKRKRWLIKAHIYIYVCVTCVDNRERAHTHTNKIPEVRETETGDRD